METAIHVLNVGVEVVGVLANFVTALLGGVALWALIFRRREISLALRVISNSFLNQRVSRLKETLGKLESLNYDNKEDRSEINALIGQICGQTRSLVDECPALNETYQHMVAFVENRKRVSERAKRRIIYEMHGHLDGATFSQTSDVIRTKQ